MPEASSSGPVAVPKIKHLRWQVTALLALALALAGLLAFAIAERQGLFGTQATLYFLADDVTGLAPGTTVRMSGLRVGKLESLELQADHTVRVTMSVDEALFARLKLDARAVVVREQLKPAAIDLRPGTASAPLPRDKPQVGYQRRGTLTDIADDLRQRLAPILDDIRQVTSVARERRNEFDAIVRNAQTISQSLADTSQQLQALSRELRVRTSGLGALGEAAIGQANRSLVRLDGLLVRAGSSLSTVNNHLPALLEKTDRALVQLDTILRDTRTVTAAAADSLPPLMRSVPPLVDESREVVQGLRGSWPLRTLLPAPPPPLLPVDSFDAAVVRDPGSR
jgi:phospholipid/cholesterol/gamma-HCH transport system substrate-binding protein